MIMFRNLVRMTRVGNDSQNVLNFRYIWGGGILRLTRSYWNGVCDAATRLFAVSHRRHEFYSRVGTFLFGCFF